MYGHANVALMNGGRKKWELEGPAVDDRRSGGQPDDVSVRRSRPDLPGVPSGRAWLRRPARRPWPGGRALAGRVQRGDHRASGPAGDGPALRPRPWRLQHSLGPGGERGRHVQERGRAAGALRRKGDQSGQGDHHVLPDRRAFEPLLVRAEGAAGLPSVRNYDGSWTEYGSVIGVPIANPAAGA